MDIQIIPIVSEKANAISEKNNRFSFKVSPEANKYEIRDLIEKLYDVKVVDEGDDFDVDWELRE